jgi:hypothetical protein
MGTFFCATLTVIQEFYLALDVDQAHTIRRADSRPRPPYGIPLTCRRSFVGAGLPGLILAAGGLVSQGRAARHRVIPAA